MTRFISPSVTGRQVGRQTYYLLGVHTVFCRIYSPGTIAYPRPKTHTFDGPLVQKSLYCHCSPTRQSHYHTPRAQPHCHTRQLSPISSGSVTEDQKIPPLSCDAASKSGFGNSWYFPCAGSWYSWMFQVSSSVPGYQMDGEALVLCL